MKAPMIRRTRLFAWTASLILAASFAKAADIDSIEGSASWDGSDPVPRGAMLEVDLIDMSRGGTAQVLSRMRFKAGNATPLDFDLHYDADLVRPGDPYALAARVVVGDEVVYRSVTAVPVFRTFQKDTPQITLHKVTPVVSSGTPVGDRWGLVSIGGKDVVGFTRVYITFETDGRAHGSFGCNRFKSTYTLDGEKLEFKRFNSTQKGCTTRVAEQERSVKSAIRRSLTYERSGETLRLLDVAGLETLRFERQ